MNFKQKLGIAVFVVASSLGLAFIWVITNNPADAATLTSLTFQTGTQPACASSTGAIYYDGTSIKFCSGNQGGVFNSVATGASSLWAASGTAVYYNGGNVGIGLSSPGSKLQVWGTFSADNSNLYTDGLGNISALSFVDKASPVYFLQPSAAVSLKTAGSVGIGMAGTPGATLDVAGTGRFKSSAIGSAAGWLQGASGGNASMILQSNAGAGSAYWISAYPLFLGLGSNGGTEPANGVVNITSSGLVGVGTSTPAAKLHVAGTSQFDTDIRIGNAWVYLGSGMAFRDNGSGGAAFYNAAGTSLPNYLSTNGSNTFFANGGGKVGIGTSTPSSTLDVAGSINGTSLCMNNSCYSSWPAGPAGPTGPQGTAGPAGASPFTLSGANAYYMAGNVGIGTSTPQTKLHVQGDITTPFIVKYQHDEPAWGANAVRPYFNKSWNATYGDFLYLGSTGNQSNVNETAILAGGTAGLAFGRGSDTGDGLSTEWMRINTSGNVGIGTTAPAAKFTIANNVYTAPFGTAYGQYQIMLYDTGTSTNSYGLGIEAGNMGFNTGGGYKFYVSGAATPALTILSNSNVGIGRSPGAPYALDVNGTIGIGGTPALSLDGVGRLGVGTTVGSGAQNTGVGYYAVYSSTGSGNTGLGYMALYQNTTGVNNTGVGFNALHGTYAVNYSVAVGNSAGGNGNYNNSVGYMAGWAETIASGNNAFGASALVGVSTSTNNVAIGNSAGSAITSGSNNVVIGGYAAGAPYAIQNNNIFLSDGAGNLRLRIDSTGAIYYGTAGTTLGTPIYSCPNTSTCVDASTGSNACVGQMKSGAAATCVNYTAGYPGCTGSAPVACTYAGRLTP